MADKRVGFSSDRFRKPLRERFPSVEALLAAPNATRLVEMLDLLRHHAAHRGALVPTTIHKAPDEEPSVEVLDAKIREMGWDKDFGIFPPGPLRDLGIELARTEAKLATYEVAMEDVLVVARSGKRHIVDPSPSQDGRFLFEVVGAVFEALTVPP